MTGPEFLALRERLGLHVVGVVGFSGQWSEQKIAESSDLKADVDSARGAIRQALLKLEARYGEKLVVSSGATMEGVPKLIYEECAKLGITAMGVTSEKAFDYPLGKMRYLIVEGKDWGQESPTFLNTSEEILMIGGGGQAKREAIAANASKKPVTVFRGYKGSADQLLPEEVPGATFVPRG